MNRIALIIYFLTLIINIQTSQAKTSKPLLQINSGGHTALIRDVVFTPDGRYLISASDDKTIRVWDWKNNKTVRFIRGEVGQGHAGKFLPWLYHLMDNIWPWGDGFLKMKFVFIISKQVN